MMVNVDLASLPGPRLVSCYSGPWDGRFMGEDVSPGADIAAWASSVGLLCKLVAFCFGTLQWPADAVDMGHVGISYL